MKSDIVIKIFCVAFFLSALSHAQSQIREAALDNASLRVNKASGIVIPEAITDMTLFEGRLRMGTESMLFAADYSNGATGDAMIDTSLVAVDKDIAYMVLHPVSKVLYYTKRDHKGVSLLYEHYEKKPGKYAVRRVKPGGFSYSVEHPVFSPDGRAMVFASDCPLGFGGIDLWYSEMRGDQWQYPQNLGRNINTVGDDVMPAMYGDFLVFSSNGRPDSKGGFDLYAARLVAQEQESDTVMMYPIGQCLPYSLGAPLCSPDDDLDFTPNSALDGGWWVVRDSAGRQEVFSFSGRLDCVVLSGVVSALDGKPIPRASVVVKQQHAADRKVVCDDKGRYVVVLQPDQSYSILFSASEFFSQEKSFASVRNSDKKLYATAVLDVSLFSFGLDTVYDYNDCFLSQASCELSPSGRARFDVIARYLLENKHLAVSLHCAYNDNPDIAFCQLLSEARLRTLKNYLTERGVEPARIAVYSALPASLIDDDSASDASSSQRVFLSYSRR